ncbi:MAG: SIS domain-containing protein [Terriglobia bacterium]
MDHTRNLKTYAQDLQEVLGTLPWDQIVRTVEVLWQCCLRGGRIFTMGNGGHCNTAAHMINDLAKHTVSSDNKQAVVAQQFRFRTLCLNDSASFVTGIGNDMGFDQIFSEQVANWVEPGDVVLGISGSGNSKNILKAFEEARKRGATTICFSGFEGGKARDLADLCIVVPCHKMVQVEDVHLIISHMIADELKRLVQGRQELAG